MYVFITFCIFALIDYIYVYTFLDKKLLFVSAGSKLGKTLSNQSHISKLKVFLDKQNLKVLVIKCAIGAISFFLFFFLNYFLTESTFSSNFWVISVLGKEINFSNIFNGNIDKVKTVYYILSSITFGILSVKLLLKCTWLVMYIDEITTEEKYTEDISSNKIFLGKDKLDNNIEIDIDELTKNMYITGSIGSGKTTGAMANITEQLIQRGIGGVILDAKGNYVNIVKSICRKYDRLNDLKIVSLSDKYSFMLLEKNIQASELAARLRQIIELLSQTNSSEPYWLDKVENVLLNFIILMDFITGRDIMVLHKMVTDDEFLLDIIQQCKEKLLLEKIDDKTCFELRNASLFVQQEYTKLDSRVSSIIKSEITRLTIPIITEYEIYDKFGNTEGIKLGKYEEIKFNLENSNQIIVLSINIGKNKSLCKIIATFLKLNFQKQILSNISKFPITFFIADEYQEFANIQDAHFLSLAREARCINILATQSYTSLKNTIKDDNATLVIIQNLVNKIWFRNDDIYTVSEVVKYLGKLDVKKENESIAEQAKESTKYWFRSGFKNKNSSISKTISYVTNKENEYDENYFTRTLKTFEALTFIPDENNTMNPKFIKFERWKEDEIKQNKV